MGNLAVRAADLLALFGILAVSIVAVAALVVIWREAEKKRPSGLPLRTILWTMTLATGVVNLLTVLEQGGTAETLTDIAGVVFPGVLLVAVLAAFKNPGRSTTPLVPVGLVAFSLILIVSALLNSQFTEVTRLIAAGILYLPGLVVAIWKTTASADAIRSTVRHICLTIVWASLVLLAINPTAAMGDLPRRVTIGDLPFRVAGVTPHPNLLAFIAAVGLILVLKHKSRLRLVHVAAIAVILVLAEARSLTIGLAVALALYWIIAGRGSRAVRTFAAVLVGLPIAVFAWPAIDDAFNDSTLGSDVTTLNSRTVVWNLVGRYWVDHPVLGWGPFTFNDATHSPASSLFFNHAHNQLLEALIEGGLVGLLLMVVSLGVVTWYAITTRDVVYAATAVITLIFAATEVPLTLHNYGFNFPVLVGAVILAILVPGPVDADMSLRGRLELDRAATRRGRRLGALPARV
ncbi:O-antigen ligase [Curtobacterium sp. MCBA15_012]|uniref:O-antigen ligase family protein n=1 Tax=Curtobacterium sp. MCBA15_012 TaxID=1898738 RepID=UPI0008DE3BED|nr:O-antigen ligase family protein [Curtobacterium sp. MCBA15_012]WIA99760.1 O-antigen ligase family protein [Curtobacterium sp. MCBA15_012]